MIGSRSVKEGKMMTWARCMPLLRWLSSAGVASYVDSYESVQ